MNGVKYNRIMQCVSLEKLAELTSISIPTIRKMESVDQPGSIYATNYRNVADALRVSPDDLVRSDYPGIEDGVPKRVRYPSRTENLSNCISVYRREHMLTFELLASHLGLTTRERARQVCSDPIPLEKHIATLARYEKISTMEFVNKYSL